MRVLFLVTSFWAMGEFTIAKEFALRLKNSGHEVAFCLPPSLYKKSSSIFPTFTLIPNSRKLNQLIFHEISYSFKPAIVILSDFLNYHFSHKHYGITREDLDILGAKVATFDIYNWKQKRLRMDAYGIESSIPKVLNIDWYGDRILPCPLVDPKKVGKNEFGYCLINKEISRSDVEKTKILKKFNLDSNKKTILVTRASWQSKIIKEDKVNRFISIVERNLSIIISYLKEKYQIICIGEKEKIYGQHNIFYFETLPPDDFDSIVSITDLYINRNFISTSMARMVLSGVKCVNFIHSGFTSLSEDFYAYKFRMFPVGWYDFLEPLVEDNPYFNLVESLKIFDINASIKKIEELLSNEDDKHYTKLKLYKRELALLDSPDTIIKKIYER